MGVMVDNRRRPLRLMGNDMCREMVSAVPKAMRYTQNGKNLDLAHFKEFNLVVMAWPAETLSLVKKLISNHLKMLFGAFEKIRKKNIF